MNGYWTHLFLLWLQNLVSKLNDPAFRRGAAHAGGTSYCQVPLVRRSSAPSLRQRGQTRVVWIDSSEALLWNHFSNLQPSLACYSLPTSAHRHPGQCKRRELGEREIYWHQNSPSHHCGLPWWFRWYRIHLQCGRPGFDPWVGKIFWRREQLPTPVFWPGEFHGQRSVAGFSPWGRKELDLAERLSLTFATHFICYKNVATAGWAVYLSEYPCARSLFLSPSPRMAHLGVLPFWNILALKKMSLFLLIWMLFFK